MRSVDTPQTRCRAGAARTDITPPVGIYHRMWGAAVHDRATGVHRPLLATLLWLEPPDGPIAEKAQLIVAVDLCLLDGADMQKIREAVGTRLGIGPHQVQIALSHTHGSGWMSRSRVHLPGGELIHPYLEQLPGLIADAAQAAVDARQPATIVYGAGRCSLAAHRDFWDEQAGQFVCGFNPTGPADDTVLVARVAAVSGETIVTVVNYACHPTTLAWDNTALSPDYVGAMREVIEQPMKAPCVFLQGASGDLGPRHGFVGEWETADRNGRQLGYAVLSALEALPPPGTRFVYRGPVVSGTTIGTWGHEPLDHAALERQARWSCRRFSVDLPYRLELPTTEETSRKLGHWQAEEEKARAAGDEAKARDCRALAEQMRRQLARLVVMPGGKVFPFALTLWRLGDARWLFVPGELYQTFQQTLRQRFADLPLIVATLTGDWQPGYLPAASSFGYGIYQDVIAVVGPGALETVLESVARAIQSEPDGEVPPKG